MHKNKQRVIDLRTQYLKHNQNMKFLLNSFYKIVFYIIANLINNKIIYYQHLNIRSVKLYMIFIHHYYLFIIRSLSPYIYLLYFPFDAK